MSDQPKCTTCSRKPNDLWECSHPACPNRKPITADAPPLLDEGRCIPHIREDE